MEASGGFEEAVATLLHEEGYSVSLVNPRRIKGYADSQLRRSKTDSADASLLARYGQREDPRLWDPPTAAESRLRELTRARQALKKEKTRTENRLDEVGDEAVRNAYQDLLEEVNEKISALEEEIEEHVEESPNLNDQCSLLDTIPGVGLQTAAIVVSELGSADRFESARQAAAYAGLVPSHHPESSSIWNLYLGRKQDVEGRQCPATECDVLSSDVLSSDDGSSIQLSNQGTRRQIGEAGKGGDGHHWSCYAETPAYLLRSGRIRSALRCLAVSRDLKRLTFTTASLRSRP